MHVLYRKTFKPHTPKKVYIVYCSYPYTDDPVKRTKEIKAWAIKILKRHNDLVLLIPHFVFDAVLDFPKGYGVAVEFNMGLHELVLIQRMDIFAYHPDEISAGVIWEKSSAEKDGVPILTYQQLYEGVRPEKKSV